MGVSLTIGSLKAVNAWRLVQSSENQNVFISPSVVKNLNPGGGREWRQKAFCLILAPFSEGDWGIQSARDQPFFLVFKKGSQKVLMPSKIYLATNGQDTI